MHLIHPVQRLMTSPDVYLFPSPIAGSYPVFNDPAYWDDGLKPVIYLKGELWHITMNLFHTLQWLGERAWFVVGLALLLWMQFRSRSAGPFKQIMPALLCFGCMWGLYVLVNVEGRYIFGIFTAILLLGAAAVRLPDSDAVRKIVAIGCIIVACGAALDALNVAASEVFAGVRQNKIGNFKVASAIGPFGNPYWEIAQTLNQRLGLKPDDQVACMRQGCDLTYWAQLAGVRIVADMSREDDYWAATPADRAKAMSLLAHSGVKAVVTRYLGAGAESEGWIPISDPNEKPQQELFARLTR